MARLSEFSGALAERLLELDCPTYDSKPWVPPKPLAERRIAIVSSAGLMKRGDALHDLASGEMRVIKNDTPDADILMGHISVNFDRSGFQQDINIAFPRARLQELADEGVIGSVADSHYSFMGATDPRQMADDVAVVADALKRDAVDTVLLVPV